MQGDINLINDYLKIKEVKEKSFYRELLRSSNEFDLKDFYNSRKSIESAINLLEINSKNFSFILRLTIFNNLLDKLLYAEGLEIGELEKSDDKLTEFFIQFYKIYKLKEECKLDDVLRGLENFEDISVALYLFSMITDSKEAKMEFLRESLKLYKNNFAAAKELYISGDEISIEILKNLYLIDIELFYSNNVEAVKEKEAYDFEFLPLGGGDTIGASCYFVRIGESKLLIDVGIKFLKNEKVLPNFKEFENKLKECEFCLITHAHLDHCGAIVELYKINNKIKFIMTKDTRKLIWLNLNSGGISSDALNTLENILKGVIILGFNQKVKLKFKKENLDVELYRAGHILGAASIFLKSSKVKVFITGDFLLEKQNTVSGAEVPNEEVDILITENTYGDKEIQSISSSKLEYSLLKKYVADGIREDKNILIPAFAIGRTQEVIKILEDLAVENNFRIYIDGDSVRLTKAYIKMGVNLSCKKMIFIKNNQYKSKKIFIREEFMTSKSLVIASSGMLKEGSVSVEYAKEMISDKNSICILTGYQVSGTLGANLSDQSMINGKRYVQIEKEKYKVNCDLKIINLSAHAGVNSILAVTKKIKAKNVILVHGEIGKEKSYINKILDEYKYIRVYQSIDNKIINL